MNFKQLFHLPHRILSEEEDSPESHNLIFQLPLQKLFYGLGLLILFFWLLKTFKIIFIALTMSLLCCFMLLPIIHFIIRKTRLNRTLVSAVVSLVFTLVLVSVSWIVINNLLYFFSNLGVFEDQLNHIINDILANLNTMLVGINNEILPNKLPIKEPSFSIRDHILDGLSIDFYLSSADSFLTFISGTFLVFIFVFFMLNEAEKTALKIKMILREEIQKSIDKNILIISSKISRYLQIKMVISLLTAMLVWLLLTAYGMENPLTWAFFTFAFNFIPNIGSVAITLLIVLMSIVQFYPTWEIPLVIGLLTALLQVVVGNILDPKLQGDQLDLSPLLILISLTFWGYIWGIIGMFLAVPMLELVRITCNNIKGLQAIATFISSGRRIRSHYKLSQKVDSGELVEVATTEEPRSMRSSKSIAGANSTKRAGKIFRRVGKGPKTAAAVEPAAED